MEYEISNLEYTYSPNEPQVILHVSVALNFVSYAYLVAGHLKSYLVLPDAFEYKISL
jgi:hypothetical protein